MNTNYVTVGTFVDPMYQLKMAARRQQLETVYKQMAFRAAIHFTMNWIDRCKALIEKLESGWVNPLANKYPEYTTEHLIAESRAHIMACEECLTRADMTWEVIHSSDGAYFFPELLNIMDKYCAH